MLLQKNTDVSYTDYTRKNGNNNCLRVSNLGHKRLVILNIKQGSFINISGSTPMYESPAKPHGGWPMELTEAIFIEFIVVLYRTTAETIKMLRIINSPFFGLC